MFTPEFLDKVMPKLSIDPGACIQCGACANICPVSGIDPEADPPRIQEPCIYCHQCVLTCLEGAIRADWGPVVAIAPRNYARYRQNLEEQARQGRFRWLVDPDSVDPASPLIERKKA